MISEELAHKASYHNPNLTLVYGLGTNVMREYDMNSAGLSVIREYGLLGKQDIARLETMDKLTRNIIIGKIRNLDKEWSKNFTSKIRSTMAEYMKTIGVEDDTLVSINNDAITVIEPRVKKPVLKLGGITFKLDGEYKTLALINRVSIYTNKGMTGLTIKGIGENGRSKCMDGFGSKLLEWFKLLENGEDLISLMGRINKFKNRLIRHEEDIEMYRSLRSGYINFSTNYSKYTDIKFNGKFEDKEWEDKTDPTETIVDFIIPLENMLFEKYKLRSN